MAPLSEGVLWRRLRTGPRISDKKVADDRLSELDAALDPCAGLMLARPATRRLVAAVADQSSYLWQLIRTDPERFLRLLAEEPSVFFERTLAALADDEALGGINVPEAEVLQRLRRAKQDIALLVAFADLGGVWTLDQVLAALSRAADVFIGVALTVLLRRAVAGGKLRLDAHDDLQGRCGLTVLGLGKLGGQELNYSSDVDLIAIFDPRRAPLSKPDEASAFFVRLLRDLVHLLQTRTRDGYVLRVDLRLRPDPGSTAVAIRLGAAFLYYESYGQNWERAALIKARHVAGDASVAARFLKGLSPFIWRKYFDYAAVADIQAMKRQIHAVKGHGEIAAAGHNVKLGRGGIREIEFFVQTQQLIFGGKRPDLRGTRTLPMLRQLQRDRWITRKAVGDLSRAYRFLRTIEHRLQMVADEQTHKLPSDEAALERFARFAGFRDGARFAAVLVRHLTLVAHHYALLFEQASGLDAAAGSLVFTGVADDPETLETLAVLGFKAPALVVATVRDWHSGRRPAVRSNRARETLTALVPALLQTFAQTSDPDGALAVFDRALDRMPAASELFAILTANAALRRFFGDILGSAPRLAREVTLRPHLLDRTLQPSIPVSLDEGRAETALRAALPQEVEPELFLDALRDYVREEHFVIGSRLMSGGLDIEEAGAAYSALATAAVRVTLAYARQHFAREHGIVPGGAMSVVAMGKLGSREMTASSDLDIIILYDFPAEEPYSDGARPLHATQYFARLTQRLVSYLTAATRRGSLYAVDMRLRPSGRQGPLASQLSAFAAYQREAAETWEHMALTRARVIAGDESLGTPVRAVIETVLRQANRPTLGADVGAVRRLMEVTKGPVDAWDLKHAPGGLLDIEFLAQVLVLGHAGAVPSLLDGSTGDILKRAGAAGLLTPEDCDVLMRGYRLLTDVAQTLRLTLDDGADPGSAGAGVKSRLARAGGAPDFGRLTSDLNDLRQAVREIFTAAFPCL